MGHKHRHKCKSLQKRTSTAHRRASTQFSKSNFRKRNIINKELHKIPWSFLYNTRFLCRISWATFYVKKVFKLTGIQITC